MTERDRQFIKTVTEYYKKHGRHDLSWRKSITPYKILVSEIMLQQTQVSRVQEKFKMWIKIFPNVGTLRDASFQTILKLWQGLGYQRRAKSLHAIAKQVSILPKKYEELLLLPGIGPYTASAMLAFAYDTFPPHLLETNIRTALIEHFHKNKKAVRDTVLYDDLARLSSYKQVQKLGARAWYYALMDYGAYLKSHKISHNAKSAHFAKQTPYKGSLRELRAKVLFAIAHKEKLPQDERLREVFAQLQSEAFIVRKGRGYVIAQ